MKIALSAVPVLATLVVQQTHLVSIDSVGGLPYSDANNWATCARGINVLGFLPESTADWCMRRPAFPYILGSFMHLTGSLTNAFLVIAFIMGVAWVWLTIEVRRMAGSSSGVLAGMAALLPWLNWGLNQSLTESLGIPLASLAAAALARGMRTHQMVWFPLAVGLTAWAEQIRPSNVIMIFIPLLLVWGLARKDWRVLGASLVAAALPVVSVWVRSRALGLQESGQGGNGWATVYGFVTGNRPWQAVLEVPGYASATSESQRWEIVRTAAIHRFEADPLVALRAFAENLWSLASNQWLVHSHGPYVVLPVALASMAYWYLLAKAGYRHWAAGRRTIVIATATATLTTLATWAVILPAGGESLRVMTTALPVLATLHLLVLRSASIHEPLQPHDAANPAAEPKAWIAVAAGILVVVLFAPWISRLDAGRLYTCTGGELALIGRSVDQVGLSRLTDLPKPFPGSANELALETLRIRGATTLTQGLAVRPNGAVTAVQFATKLPVPMTDQTVCIPDFQPRPTDALGYGVLQLKPATR